MRSSTPSGICAPGISLAIHSASSTLSSGRTPSSTGSPDRSSLVRDAIERSRVEHRPRHDEFRASLELVVEPAYLAIEIVGAQDSP